MPRPMHNTTGLPRQLREELGLKDNYREKRLAPHQRGPASRKERRKEERSNNRGSGKLTNANQPAKFQKSRDDLEDDDISDLDSDEPADENTTFSSSKHMNPTRTEHTTKSILKSRRLSNGDGNSELKSSRIVSSAVRSKLEADEAEISQLEKKLGLKGRKQLPKSFEDDGLAHLLGEHGTDSDSDEQRKRKREGDEWLQAKRRKAQARSQPEKGRNRSTGSNEDMLGEFEQEEDSEFEGLDEDLEGESESDDEAEHTSNDEGDEEKYYDGDYGANNVSSDEGQEGQEEFQVKTRENPYVAPVTKSNSNRNKYVPPSLRGSSELGGESQVRLRRQTQGLLNKLSEANLISILNDVETLYRENPRQNVTSTIVSLLLGLVLNPSSLSDTFIILHAGFIAAMYKVTGMDFGAEMIQNLVEAFDDLESHDEATVGKKALNMMSLLSQLYNFHVIASNLVFDYIRIFLQDITESNTELLLKIIRSKREKKRSGFNYDGASITNIHFRFRTTTQAG
jgi:nucleolar MIF4G domain-containing protein 1